MGVTCVTHETTYWEKVPSTVKPLYLPLRQPDMGMTSATGDVREERGLLTLLEAFPAGLAVQAGVGEPLDAYTVADLDGRVLGVLADGDDTSDTLRGREVSVREQEDSI